MITENLPLYRVIFYGYIKKNNYIYIYINVCVGRRKDYVLLPISRIREVHQSLLTVPFTAALPLFQVCLDCIVVPQIRKRQKFRAIQKAIHLYL